MPTQITNQSVYSNNNTTEQNLSIIAMTVCCMDIYPQNDKFFVGGNSVNFAAQCKKNGVNDIAVLGCVGTDDFGWAVINRLTKNQINISHLYIREGKTASNRIYITDAGERYFLPDSWDGGVYQTFTLAEEDWCYAGEHDIVAIPANNPNFTTALEVFGGSGKLVVDFLDSRDVEWIETVLPKLELGFISGDNEIIKHLKPFSEKLNIPIIVTLGVQGSVALFRGEQFFQDTVPVDTIVDTTGCGDSYQAAFTVSWWREHDLAKAMKAGAIAAAGILARMGGV